MSKPTACKQTANSSLSSEGYYSSTAYNTQQGDSLANNPNRLTEEEIDGKYEDISEYPAYLNDHILYSAFNHAKLNRLKKAEQAGNIWAVTESTFKDYYWQKRFPTWHNAYRNWQLLKIFSGFLIVTSLISLVLFFILQIIVNDKNIFSDPGMIFGLSISYLIIVPCWIISKIAMHFCNDNQYGYFNRRTGMLNFYIGKNKPMLEVPFREFTPTIKRVMAASGEQYILGLRARTTERTWGYKFDMLADCLAYRDFLYQYMDVSQPLPDIPEFELCRDKDPVTLNYDHKHKRNPRYWRDKSVEDIETMVQEARKKAWQTWGLKFIKYNQDSRPPRY